MKTCSPLLALSLLGLLLACEPTKPAEQAAETPNYLEETPEARAERMAWWKEARFGMFIHWGLYAVPAGEHNGQRTDGIGEWIMDHLHIPIAEYEPYAAQFNPVKFQAEEWVRIAKQAGMKYIVITSKHHDGFALWDSKVTEWDIMDATPFKRDILAELAEACKKEGIRLCFYHSIMDWHHPDAQAAFEPNYHQYGDSGLTNPQFPRYIETYMKPQIQELLSRYGDIGVMWFDGEWIPDFTHEQGLDLYQFVRSLQPDIVINNRVDKGRQGMQGMTMAGEFVGDFGTPEQEIPDTGMPGVDWESCMTMNDTWGYKSFDDNWKSTKTLIHNLIDITSKGGNFLLNVGPTAEGLIPEASVERLAGMGQWMQLNSEAIYGAEASPFAKPAWGRFTHRGDQLYAHVFDWPKNGKLLLPEVQSAQAVQLLASGSALSFAITKAGLEIQLPSSAPDSIATVIAIQRN